MSEYSYQHKGALYSVAFNVLFGVLLGYFGSREGQSGLDWSAVGNGLALGFITYVIHFAYVFNNSLRFEGGALILHRSIGRSRRVPLSAIRSFRLAEHRAHSGHKFRELTIRYADRKLRFNVSDLAEEKAFVRALESRLQGAAKVPDEQEDPSPLALLQRQLDRLRS